MICVIGESIEGSTLCLWKKTSDAPLEVKPYYRSSMLCVNRCVIRSMVKALYCLHVILCYKCKRMNSIHCGEPLGAYAGSGVATCFEVISRQNISITPEYPSAPFSCTTRALRQG